MRQSWKLSAWLATIVLLLVVARSEYSLAQDDTHGSNHANPKHDWPRPSSPWRTTWIGAQITGTDWAVYTGTTAVLFGDDIGKNGWRIRTTGGYSRYSYEATRTVGTTSSLVHFGGHHGFGDLLIGYQHQFDNWIIKGFAGVASAGHVVVPFDPDNPAIGTAYGATGALEVWLNFSEATWLSANANYSTLFDSFNTSASLGHRFWPALSFGLELGGTGNADYAAVRSAAFGRYEWSTGEFRLSAGMAANRDLEKSPYAALNIVLHY